MTADHVTLLEALEHISSFEGKFAQATDKAAVLAELRKVFDELMKMMMPHLDEEEDVLVPILYKHFTHASFDELIQEIIKKFNPIDLLWELAPMMQWFDFWCVPSVGCTADRRVAWFVVCSVLCSIVFICRPNFAKRFRRRCCSWPSGSPSRAAWMRCAR